MSKKKKILHIIQSLDNGGCENMLLRTLPLLGDFEHKIVTLKEPGELAPKFVSAGIIIETLHISSFLDISGLSRLRRFIQTEQPGIILTYLFHADMIGRLALHNATAAPIIPFLRTTYNHPKYLIARILEWLTKPLVKRYLANSEAVKNFYVTHLGVDTKKITVIPNGIDITYFDSITPDPELRKSVGIAPDDFTIICVANLHINKGHRYLLEAFEDTHKKLPNVHLLIVGDGVERDNLKSQLRNYDSQDNITFLGHRTDIPELLKISDLFVLPTLFEGQSNALLEAMASGIPVITTDIPENRDLIEHNVSGILVPTQASAVLSQKIQELRHNQETRRALSTMAKQTIRDTFSLDRATNSFQRILDTL